MPKKRNTPSLPPNATSIQCGGSLTSAIDGTEPHPFACDRCGQRYLICGVWVYDGIGYSRCQAIGIEYKCYRAFLCGHHDWPFLRGSDGPVYPEHMTPEHLTSLNDEAHLGYLLRKLNDRFGRHPILGGHVFRY